MILKHLTLQYIWITYPYSSLYSVPACDGVRLSFLEDIFGGTSVGIKPISYTECTPSSQNNYVDFRNACSPTSWGVNANKHDEHEIKIYGNALKSSASVPESSSISGLLAIVVCTLAQKLRINSK
jgi:hypothetical protein